MSWIARAAALVAAVAVAGGLITLYRANHEAAGAEEQPVVAPSRVHRTEAGPVVVLDAEEIARIGLRTAALRATTASLEVRAPATVVAEPERTATIRAPVAGRLAAADGAWPAYGATVAAGAELGRVSDALPLTAPRGGTVVRVGARPGELVEAGQVLLELVDYSRPVVEVPIPGELGARPPRTIGILPPGAARRIPARLVGAAPAADPVTRRPLFTYRADASWPGARPGVAVTAALPTAATATTGVLVPPAAVVQWDGMPWAYVARGGGRFARLRVPTAHPTADGWLGTAPFVAGDSVVVVGAEQLLSEEFRARVTVGEESGE